MKEGSIDQFDIFAKFPAPERRLLESVLVDERRRVGHVFMREGDQSSLTRNALYLIIEGTVGVTCRRPDNRGFAVNATMGPGEIFGIVGLVTDLPRSATCTAKSDVVVAHLERPAFMHLHKQRSPLAARFELMLARQLVRNLRRLTSSLVHALETGESAGVEGLVSAVSYPEDEGFD